MNKTKSEMIDELKALLLDRYNGFGQSENPVTDNDTYFKSYLIGYLTWRLSDKDLKEDIEYFQSKIGEPA